jgi:hypothetical protein
MTEAVRSWGFFVARRFVPLAAWLVAGLGACAPQVVDAVDRIEATAGTGGGSAGGGAGGRGGAVGAGSGSGGTAGACLEPDGCGCTGDADRDLDGTRDCDDGCPDQPSKLEPGLCGCDLPDDDTSESGVASCSGLIAALVHRYAFDGSGTAVVDARGGPEGTVIGSALTGTGSVRLEGRMSDQYVDLPNGLLSALESVTLEAWVLWYDGAEWQRIFDFGDDQTGVEGARGFGSSYLFLTPRSGEDGDGQVRVAYQRTGYSEIQLDATRTLPIGKLTHVAVTFDAATETLALYLDGAFENSKIFATTPVRLSVINDINSWLGRSQFIADAGLGATIEEFRIYSTALSPAQIRVSYHGGPDAGFLAGLAE